MANEQNSNDVQPVKRGRGRPKKVVETPVAEATLDAPKRGRGRPRKEPVEAETPKRPRGRPRKEAASTPVAAVSAPPVAADPVEPPKAKRGLFGKPKEAPVVTEPPVALAKPAPKPQEAAPVVAKPEAKKKPLFGAKTTPREEAPKAKPRKPLATKPVVEFIVDQNDRFPLPIPTFRPIQGQAMEKKPEPKPVAAEPVTLDLGDDTFIPRFRPKGAPRPDTPRAQETTEESPKTEGRDRRNRGRVKKEEAAVETPVAVEPAPVELPKNELEQKVVELVPVPADAPQVISRNGIPTLVHQGTAIPPLFFFANAHDEARVAIVSEEIRTASANGIHVFVHYVDLEVREKAVDDAVKFAEYLLKTTLKEDPDAKVMFRVAFSAPDGWERTYRRARYNMEGGGLGEPSLSDDEFWSVAETCLQEFVSQLRKSANADRILGLHLERGEWFQASGTGYDTSPAAEDAFRLWCRRRYRNDNVALCASWFDGQVQFETISVPEYGGEIRAGEEFVRTARKARRWVDYHLFLSDVTVDRIGDLAHVVKKASDGYFLVGVSYGYTFEWAHPSNGHLGLGKLLRNPEVDFIAGPPSYKNREPGGTAPFPCPIDSFALNGKLYISEEDFKTPISGKVEPDDFNPVMRTPQALESVHWRGYGAAAAHAGGICWMDLWGNGWLNTPGIWERGGQLLRGLQLRMEGPIVDPDVAVFIDERSLAYLVDQHAFELLIQNVRESILRSGLSVGFYLLSDLAHRETFPEAKLHVFLNAWDIRPEVRSAIKTRLQRDGKILFWLYAAGLFDSGRDALERVREVTGIAIKRQPFASKSGTAMIHRKHPLCEGLPDRLLSSGSALEPSYFAIPEDDSVVLGEYTSTGLPSILMRDFRNEEGGRFTSIFLGEPVVTPALFRNLGQMAGAHIWNHQEDVVHVRAPFLTIHCKGAGTRTVTLPDKQTAYNLTTAEWMTPEGTQVKFSATDGSTHVLLVGIKADIEALLRKPVADILRVDAIPDRPANTLRLEDIHFDVPIMKLDEWVEDSWEEGMSDDLLLRPSQLDLETFDSRDADPASNVPQRERDRGGRKRGRRRGKTGPKQESGSKDFDVMEMNVVFRKRD